jgi:hypothetical protein
MRETRPRPDARLLHALVVCDDEDTSLQLRDYLAQAGVRARATRQLDDAWRQDGSGAIVLLPDAFDPGAVTDGLRRLSSRSPPPWVIVVTAVPRLFEPLLESWGHPDSVVVMPKPVWGWTILDLLRGWQNRSA